MQTPSPDHAEFDHLCREVDEFEPLPAVTADPRQADGESGEGTSLDGQILAGLVSPV